MTKKKIAIAAVLVCILAMGIAAVPWAADPAPTVIFDAKAKTFTLQNCTQYTYGDEDGDGTAEQYPDLFPAIKNAMPGDSFDQSIRVKVINAGKDVSCAGFAFGAILVQQDAHRVLREVFAFGRDVVLGTGCEHQRRNACNQYHFPHV